MLEAWSEVFASASIGDLEDAAWIRHLFGFLGVSNFLFAVPEPLIKLTFVKARLMDELTEYFLVPTTLILFEVGYEESHLVVSLAVLRVGLSYHLSSYLVYDGFVTRLLFGLFITRNAYFAKDRISLVVAKGPKKLYGVQSVLVGRGFTLGAKAERILSLDSFQLFGKGVVLLMP